MRVTVVKQKLIIGTSSGPRTISIEAVVDPETSSKEDAYEMAHDAIDRFYEDWEDDNADRDETGE